ncbi:hypothetical protein RM780_09725 [Streptomyces sp. DSM 44917]|uniref:Uncharacterized protein n=1 Tax=Streptomyces boetiae TaxID=3075541 RepID=A0ABU2L711_9ACTN|nr:hypothetical protein [Streptomyces sp. DSM 44917]MDT0307241.1 hypothetical protein [Streptomyces sp. DSM 44917]
MNPHCPSPGPRLADACLAQLLTVLGPGRHSIVVAVAPPPQIESLDATVQRRQPAAYDEFEAIALCLLLDAALAPAGEGGIITRSYAETAGYHVVRGWRIRDGWPRPLSAAQVRLAATTEVETGRRLPPEPGVLYRPGLPIPPLTE